MPFVKPSKECQRDLNSRPKGWIRLLRFGAIGVFNTGAHAALLVLEVKMLGISYGVSNLVAYALLSSLSFILNARLSFGVVGTRHRFLRFQLVGFLSAGTCYGLGWFAEQRMWPLEGLVLITALILPLMTFTLHDRFTFR